MCVSRKFRQGEGVLTAFLSNQRTLKRAVWTSLEKQLDPRGPSASLRGRPDFLRNPIATYFIFFIFQGALVPSGSAHEAMTHLRTKIAYP